MEGTEPKIAKSKHRVVYEFLKSKIASGEYGSGAQLPTEHELAQYFGHSRPTAARALNDLESDGLIERRAGAGSFVVEKAKAANSRKVMGLLIPGLGNTEIFEPICGRIAAEAELNESVLMWGPGIDQGDDLRQRLIGAAMHFLETRVNGVFFAPVEMSDEQDNINYTILDLLSGAGVPVILLDRDVVDYPQRSKFDLVGLDNCRAGYVLGSHMMDSGVDRIHFFTRKGSAPTVRQRIHGCHLAALNHPNGEAKISVHTGMADDVDFVKASIPGILNREKGKKFGIVCSNDNLASQLMVTLDDLGIHVPGDVIIGAFDDVRYSSLLKPSLTTIAQPCDAIGKAAFNAMSSRIENPELPPREILINGSLCIRKSTAV